MCLRPWAALPPLMAALLCSLPVRADAGDAAPACPDARESASEGEGAEADEDSGGPCGEGVYRPTASGPFTHSTAPITPVGRLLFQPILSVALTRGTYDAHERYEPLPTRASLSTTSLTLFMELGLLERVAAGAQLTVLHTRRGLAGEAAHSTGLGDTLFFGRGILLCETPGALPEVTLLAQVKLPTGRAVTAASSLLDTDIRGTGSTDLTAGLDFTKGVRPVLLHLDLLYTHALPARVGGVDTAYGGTFSWSLSGEWPFVPERYALLLEASGRHQGAPRLDGVELVNGSSAEVVLSTGVEFLFSPDLQILVGYQRTLWGRNVPALDAFVATLVPTLF